jgi:hypothetical protein
MHSNVGASLLAKAAVKLHQYLDEVEDVPG